MAMQLNDPTRPWRAKLTRIKKMWLQPCQVDVFVWTFGFFVASPVLLFSLHSPDCIDYAYDRARIGHRKSRKGLINPAQMATPLTPPSTGYGWAAFQLGNFAQRIGFYMTMIDASLDWVIYGTSFAYQLSGCRDPSKGYGTVFFNDTVPFLGFGVGDHEVDSWATGSAHIFQISQNGIGAPVGHSANAGFSITQKPFPSGGSKPAFTARIIDLQTGQQTLPVPGSDNPNGTRSATFLWDDPIDVTRPHDFRLIIHLNENGIWYGSAMMNASGDNYENLTKDYCGQKPLKD